MLKVDINVDISYVLLLMISLRMMKVLLWLSGSINWGFEMSMAPILVKVNKLALVYQLYFLNKVKFEVIICMVLLVTGSRWMNSITD